MMLHNTNNYWVSFPLLIVRYSRDHKVPETDLFPSLGEWEMPTLLGALEGSDWGYLYLEYRTTNKVHKTSNFED
jgi:hypothetical protein